MSLRSLAFLLALAAVAPPAFGDDVHGFQHDPVDHYGSRFLAGVIVLGVALVLYSLLRYRGRTPAAFSWGLLVTGVGLLPGLVSGFGSILVLQRAEKVEFCGSCHLTMKSYVDDMHDPKSGSLAALHFKNRYIADNQCYECHTSYGVFGTLEAKAGGVKDVYKYYTRTYTLPIKARTPYRNGDCLKCHAESVKWAASHGDQKASLFTGQVTCMECHGESTPAHRRTQAR